MYQYSSSAKLVFITIIIEALLYIGVQCNEEYRSGNAETLIVWSESDTCDLALSFQEKSGCEEIWAKICEVQGRDPGETDGGDEETDDGELSEGSSNALSSTGATDRVVLPPIEIGRLAEVDTAIQNHLATQALREKMANAIETESILPKLVDIFHMCEDIEHNDGLRTLYSIAKNLFMLNRNSLNETLLSDKFLKDVIGMLEYDPAHEVPRKHREFLYEKAKFREVLPIANDELKVCLPMEHRARITFLKYYKSYIFNFVSYALHVEALLHQNLQANDVLGTIEPCIKSPDPDTRTTIVDMLALLVDHSPQLVRDYLLRQAKDKSDVLRTLLDPDNMVSMQKSDRSEFLSLFYQRSIYTLVRPMIENVKGGFIKRGALKMLRTVLAVKDDFYNRYIVREKVLDRVVECFVRNGSRYNLLNSAMLELFDYIRSEDIKLLVKYTVENHMAAFEDVTYVKLFAELKIRYEQQRDRENTTKSSADERVPSPAAFVKERQMNISDRSRTPSPLGSPTPSVTQHVPEAREDEVSSSQTNSKENNSSMGIKSLVDYDESDSDEDETTTPNDSLPSSSTGSPIQLSGNHETDGTARTESSFPPSPTTDLSHCDDDVSSTSGEEESSPTSGASHIRRKRASSCEIDGDVMKRTRTTSET
ncbi:hypothetical protein DICVIV_03510 [Dictyocaulus viviparus]|uniref:Uncharacterized protein n=1 Tax=Dictyocaulus viviparus TaxID=29172 RepID=A0A0D8Y2C6_DICVI|nr:hypothetical protein DICVIV_03510 [Dictyocaulus viviparus]